MLPPKAFLRSLAVDVLDAITSTCVFADPILVIPYFEGGLHSYLGIWASSPVIYVTWSITELATLFGTIIVSVFL